MKTKIILLLSILGMFLTSCTNTTSVIYSDGKVEEVSCGSINCNRLNIGDSVIVRNIVPSSSPSTIYGIYLGTIPERYSSTFDSTEYIVYYTVGVVIRN